MLRTKAGDPFSQLTFDHDLKMLSDEYDRAEPMIESKDGKIFIEIKLWQKPMIRSISWSGNKKFSTRKLQSELDIDANTVFNRDKFNKAFNKVKDYYVKKGYFNSELEYKIIPYPNTNEIDIQITVNEGNSGHISKIVFSGFDKKEESMILSMMVTKKYNFFTSWVTGTGNYHEEALDHDKLVIVNYLQNRGFADARVNIQVKENHQGRLEIFLSTVKGEKYHFGDISIEGNILLTEEQINKVLTIHDGTLFSPELLQANVEEIKDLYGKDGYIESSIQYTLHLAPDEHIYNVQFQIEEGEQFRIGLIRVLGNVSTSKNVILRESLLIPGEVFDSRRLKATQEKLEAIGYFKSVNVYAVKTPEDQELGENYRDVIIEVEETHTGNISLFFGFSTVDDIFTGIDIAENNFNHRGLYKWWKEGFSSLRGAGEFAHFRVQFGKLQQNYMISWLDPYYNDTLWRFGFELNYSISRIQSDDYKVSSFGGSFFGGYPITSYWTFGWKYRLRNNIVKIHGILSKEAQQQRRNSGLISGVGTSITYDSTDNAFRPHRGLRSITEIELGGVRRHTSRHRVFPFARIGYLNNYYYPVWRKGTLKLRWDFKFLVPFGQGIPRRLPINERYFLGGETTVRGYRAYRIGPRFKKSDGKLSKKTPTGGVSSMLLSIEYNQEIVPMVDLFVFFDGGSISLKRFDIPDIRMSYGAGTRLRLSANMPMTIGVGFPINPQFRNDVKRFFIAMGGEF